MLNPASSPSPSIVLIPGESTAALAKRALDAAANYIPPTPGRVMKYKDPNFRNFLFEWHPFFDKDNQTIDGKVYVIALNGRFQDGVFVPGMDQHNNKAMIIGEHCLHHAQFYSFVQNYLRGYRQGRADQKMIDSPMTRAQEKEMVVCQNQKPLS